MKKFLAVYLGSQAAREQWDKLDEATRKERQAAGLKAWNDWVAIHKAALVDMGSPLGKTKRAAKDGITDVKNMLAAFTIVQAESHDAAAKMFENHPHFTIFPGDSIEIMECLAIPGQ